MFRRPLAVLLATGAATLLLPATAAQARCYFDPLNPDAVLCVVTCAVQSALGEVYC